MKISKPTPAGAVLASASLVLSLALVPAALAGKGGGGGKPPKNSPAAPLSLVSESVWNSPNPSAPAWCLNEDDYHKRTWTGSLDGSFTATEQLCGLDTDYSGGMYWDAGGIGIQADLYVTGTPSALSITSPNGGSHSAVFVGSSASNGVTTSHYQVCYVPPYALASNSGGTPLSGGTWQISLSGNVSKVTLTETAQMADVTFQQANCPASEQNLVQ